MKKSLLSFLLFTCHFISVHAQLTDTTCIKSRWIALKPTEKNSVFFPNDPIENQTSILYIIHKLVNENKLTIYDEESDYQHKGEWTPIPYVEYEINPLSSDTNYTVYRNDYFQFRQQSTTPFTNIYGEDSVEVLPDGTMQFIYPPAKIYTLTSANLSEIRIKEERFFDSKTNKFIFKAVGISFCRSKSSRKQQELFWVKLSELYTALEKKESYIWYDALINKKYIGFQYMQVGCYDDRLRY